MNWTCRLVAVALAAVASLSLDVYAQLPSGSKLSQESAGVCPIYANIRSDSGVVPEEPYNDGDAYEVYSAIIPTVDPNPETNTWFIRIDTWPLLRHGSSLDARHRKEWKQARGLDTALDDYLKVNAKHWLLQRKFTLPKPYKLVTRDEIKTIFPPSFRGGRFGELWLELSAVGFNVDRTVAWTTWLTSARPTTVARRGSLLYFRSRTASGRCRRGCHVGLPRLFLA